MNQFIGKMSGEQLGKFLDKLSEYCEKNPGKLVVDMRDDELQNMVKEVGGSSISISNAN